MLDGVSMTDLSKTSQCIRALARLGTVCVVISCAQRIDREKKPTAPEVDHVLEAYESPTAPFDQDTAAGLLSYIDETYGVLELLELEERILDPIFEALEEEPPGSEEEPPGSGGGPPGSGGANDSPPTEARFPFASPVRVKQQPVTLEGDGFLRVTRICEGWGEPVVDEDKNGSLVAIVGFTDAGLDPVLFADMFGCRYRAGTGDVLIENGQGDLGAGVALRIAEGTGPDELGQQPILFVLDLHAEIDARIVDLPKSFRFDPSTDLYEFLFDTVHGTLVLLVRRGSLLGIRAATGEYSCDADARTCTAGDGSVVSF